MVSLKGVIASAEKKGFSKKEIIDELLKKGYSKEEISLAFKEESGGEVYGKELPLLEIIKKSFSQPTILFTFFRDRTLLKSFGTYAVVSLIVMLVGYIIGILISSLFLGHMVPILSLSLLGTPILFSFFFYLLGLAGTFVYSGISHLVLMKNQGEYKDTYNVVTYSLIPCSIISGIVPYIGWLSIVYSIILMVYGFSHYHKVSKGRAVFAALLPIILAVILFALFLVFFIILVLSSFGF